MDASTKGVLGHMPADINRGTMVKAGMHLELKFVHLTILTFTKFETIQNIHNQIDNKVALIYMVKIEGTHSKDLL